jgi:asparagine synthase (glutamine-hydrolysing)
MLSAMAHEPWYRRGTHECDALGAYVGWIRHPGELSDSPPDAAATVGDVVLVLAGEVFPELAERRASGSHRAKPGTAHLIRRYETDGKRFVESLNGCFSGVVLDKRRRTTLVFNDRYGMHRLFIHRTAGALYFASEAKALLAAVPQLRAFDPIGLAQLLACGCPLEQRSLYAGVEVLAAASLVEVGPEGKHRHARYFDPRSWEQAEALGAREFGEQLAPGLRVAAQRSLAGELAVGMSLTGGLDSRMVLAALSDADVPLPCYTFGSHYRRTFDARVAEAVARSCGRTHEVIVLGDTFLAGLPRYLEKAVYIADGYLGLAGAAELYANSLARRIAPVRLTANGGGELLRGDRAFKCRMPRGGFVTDVLRAPLHEAERTFLALAATHPVTFAMFRQLPWQSGGRLAVERSQLVLRTPFTDNELVRLVYRAPALLRAGTAASLAVIGRHAPQLLRIPTDRGLLATDTGLVSAVRRLKHEALFKAEYWSTHGMPSWLARWSRFGLRPVLEHAFAGQHKFQHFSVWSRTTLASYLRAVLLEGAPALDAFVERRAVERMLAQHLSGQRNYLDELDKLLALTLAGRMLLQPARQPRHFREAPAPQPTCH